MSISRLIAPSVVAWIFGIAGTCLPAVDGWAQQVSPVRAPIPFKPEAESAIPGPGQWLMAGLVCVGVLAAMLVWLRFRTAATVLQSGDLPAVVGRTVLSPHVRLVVVRYAERRLLLAVSSTGVTCLRDDPFDGIGCDVPGGAGSASE